MPTIDKQEIISVLDYAEQIARGMGNQLSTTHVLMAIINSAPDNLKAVLDANNLSNQRLLSHRSLDKSTAEHPAILEQINQMAERACLSLGQSKESPIHLLMALIALSTCRANILLYHAGINMDALQAGLFALININVNTNRHRPAGTNAANLNKPIIPSISLPTEILNESYSPLELGKKSILQTIGTDLSLLASQGKIGPIIGRDTEISLALEIMGKRSKCNPIFIGEAGVGKTAVVEGLAIRLLNQSGLAKRLQNKRIFSLNINSLVAGTGIRGQFEDRIKLLLEELTAHPEIIIFIDEIHTIVGSGSTEGSSDLAQTIKPVLARGEIHCIGATDLEKYRKYIEKDAALERRFQPITVEAPNAETTLAILRGLKDSYQSFHQVIYSNEALESAITLAVRYIPDRNLPDKAIDLIDQAGSKKSSSATKDNAELIVSAEDIALIVKEWTNIPVITSSEEKGKLLALADNLKKSIIGQDQAINILSSSLLALRNNDKPIGSFLFLGPTGVGKTALAKKLALELFGDSNLLIRFDMSEYQEKHAVSRLTGAPPGYVGHDEGGQLTDKVHRHPFSIVLFDEIEKAHPKIFDILLQILDDGHLTDSHGRKTDFRNTIIILTSNIRPEKIANFGFNSLEVDSNNSQTSIDQALIQNGFRLEFINRLDAKIVFNNLDQNTISSILEIQLAETSALALEMGISLSFEDDVKQFLITEGFNQTYGARNLERAINKHLRVPLGRSITNNEIISGDQIKATLSNKKVIFTKTN